jgi:hypothetical protein
MLLVFPLNNERNEFHIRVDETLEDRFTEAGRDKGCALLLPTEPEEYTS